MFFLCREIAVIRNVRNAIKRNGEATEISLAGAATRIIFVATNTCLSRQNICRDKYIFVATNICRYKLTFVSTNMCLSRQDTFVATKTILVSAHANDTEKGILTLPRGRIKRNREDTHCWEQTPIIQNRTRQACSVIRTQSCIQNQTTQWPSLRSRHLLLSSFFHFAVAKYTAAAACLLMKSHCGQSQQLVGGDFNINEYPTLKENMCASIHVCARRNVTKRKKCESTYVYSYVYVVASVRVCVCVVVGGGGGGGVCVCARANVFGCTFAARMLSA